MVGSHGKVSPDGLGKVPVVVLAQLVWAGEGGFAETNILAGQYRC